MNHRFSGPTLRLDQEYKINFKYQGRRMQGFSGDTIATAMYANGVRIFSRSFEYHRPRGLYSMDGESSTCMVQVNNVPNIKGEITPLKEGMDIAPQNVLGSPEWDWMAGIEKLDWLMRPGFYYKIFHKPAWMWPFFAKFLRNVAGLGKLRETSQQGKFENLFLNCDVCVVGAGPAGMSAALSAADKNLRVILLESRSTLGGFYDWRTAISPWGEAFYLRGRKLAESVNSHKNIRVFSGTHLTGIFSGNQLTAVSTGQISDPFDECYLEIRAGSVVMATGCQERPLIFENNERPGIMQCSCAHRLARTYGLLPWEKAVFCTADDLMLEAAVDLSEMGLTIAAVADIRTRGYDTNLVDTLKKRNIPFLNGAIVLDTKGKKGIKKVLVKDRNGKTLWFQCDLLVASAGYTPVSAPLLMTSTKFSYNEYTGSSLPVKTPDKIHVAGRLNGLQHPEAIENSGRLAGLKAAADLGISLSNDIGEVEKKLLKFSSGKPRQIVARAPSNGRKSFVCFDEDVTVQDIYHTADEGFDSVELCKRYSTAGMGPGQSGIPGDNLPLILSEYHHLEPGSVLPSKVRSPLRPILLGTLVGKHYHCIKQTPLRRIQQQMGGSFIRAGKWERAQHFGDDPSGASEILNVHTSVGLMDVSTLGKFRIAGKDSIKVLQRLFISDLSGLKLNQMKYTAQCNEDGCLIDDGMVIKRNDNDYYFTTTSARAAETEEWFKYHTRFENWDYHIVNLTDVLGAINLAGPKSSKLLEKIVNTRKSDEDLLLRPYFEAEIAGNVPARILRVGFVADPSWEIHAPAASLEHVWKTLLKEGREFGIKPFGLEAQNVLRIERGHIIIGDDTELRTTLLDLGLGYLWDRNKSGTKTVGAPALHNAEFQKGRMKLIGFKTNDPLRTPPVGAVIVDTEVRGYVTSSRYSEKLKQSIGMAIVEEKLSELGMPLKIFIGGKDRVQIDAVVHKRSFLQGNVTSLNSKGENGKL